MSKSNPSHSPGTPRPTPEEERLEELPPGSDDLRLPAKADPYDLFAELDLSDVLEILANELQDIDEIHIFGSRRFRSGSTRSDVDLLIVGSGLPQASVVAAVAREIDTYLDVFVLRGSTAQSAVNESVITATDPQALKDDLNTLLLWRRGEGWIAGDFPRSVRVIAGFNPPYSLKPSREPEPLVEKVDVLFVSALSHEHTAMLSRFDHIISSPPGIGAQFQLGEITAARRTRSVAACVSDRAGNLPAAITTYRGIELFRPQRVVLVGITAGIEHRVRLGDLIVPDTVIEYEAIKVTPDGEEHHGRHHEIAPDLIARVKGWQEREQFLREIAAARPGPGRSNLTTDSMASGNKVIASAERATVIAETARKIVAIEMEALGVVEACLRFDPPVPALIVKAVSDYADKAKDDTWHRFASHASASLAAKLFRAELI
jgi:nucleoside phosphorylase/predicted nucleotidyltransferase